MSQLAESIASYGWLFLGRWLERKGLASLAGTCFRHAAGRRSGSAAEAAFRLAEQSLSCGQFREAAEICERALQLDDRRPRLWCALGAARRHMAQMELACQAYERALEIAPGYAQALSNLGEWCLMKGDAEGALAKTEAALMRDPHLLEARNNRVAALYELGRYADAENAAREAIETYPEVAALHVNLGNILLHTGKARPAVKAFFRALECNPECSEAQLALAMLYGETRRLAETLEMIRHEIAVKGETAQRLAQLALAQQAGGDLAAAEATCLKVLEMQPESFSALVTLAGCLSTRGDHLGAIELHRKALAANPNLPSEASNIAFESTYLPGLSQEELFGYHADWGRRFDTRASPADYPQTRDPERPLRIGYVSGDFGSHPVGFLLRDVIRNHDRSRHYIHCYSMMRQADDITNAIHAGSDAWIDALLMSDEELADQIREDRIDILVDLSGHTAYNRLKTFTLRPAPVQATWIGYFNSTGLTSIDYYITDPWTTPGDTTQIFSETPVWLPHSRFCYSPPAYSPDVAPLPCLKSDHVTFGSFNRIEKLVDPVVEAWARILAAVPESRLILKSGSLNNAETAAATIKRFEAQGVAGDRLDLRGPSVHIEMLAEYADVDIALDPFPFNGGMTTLEALWMGIPVVTLAGEGIVSRQSTSALANIGLGELIFSDLDAYIRGTVDLAGDPERLRSLRASLRGRMAASPLCQPEAFARDLEALLREMWRAWCRGEKLPAFAVKSSSLVVQRHGLRCVEAAHGNDGFCSESC